MKTKFDHPWNLSENEAISLQVELSKKVITYDKFYSIKTVVGVDVAYAKSNDTLIAAAVVLDIETLEIIEKILIEDNVRFPYISGLFSFREAPAIVKTLESLNHEPDLIMCDAQGLAHPRRFGLACHLGILFDKPSIGTAKTRYCGEYQEPGKTRGSYTDLKDDDEVIGSVLRTQENIKPIFVSIGHKISLKSANKITLKLTPKYRLPQTTRLSDQAVKKSIM